MTTASSTASTALESRKRASALGPEIPVLVGRPRPLAVAPKAAGERKEGVVERERCDIPCSHGPNRPGGAADRAGRDPPPAADLDARQLVTAQEAPDRALRHPQTARRLGRREPSHRHQRAGAAACPLPRPAARSNVSPLAPTSTTSRPPSPISPAMIFCASAVSTVLWMTRLSGRAPYTASNTRSARKSLARSVNTSS